MKLKAKSKDIKVKRNKKEVNKKKLNKKIKEKEKAKNISLFLHYQLKINEISNAKMKKLQVVVQKLQQKENHRVLDSVRE